MTRPDRFAELDRFAPLFPAPEVAIESVHRRRAQRRRRRTIAAVAAASLAVGGLGVLSMTRSPARVVTSSGVENVDAPASPATTDATGATAATPTTAEPTPRQPTAPQPFEACARFADLDALNIRPERLQEVDIPGPGDVTLTRNREDLVADAIEATDPRLTGTYQFGHEHDDYRWGTDGDDTPEQLEVAFFTDRIVTEDGAWVGNTFDIISGADFERWDGPGDIHFVGEGAYEGLSVVATVDGLNPGDECGMRLTGFIVDTIQLTPPPAPED